ncbi:hypothetical protein ACA910_013241 [Epithemia clementina (nom. ined.)]
MSKGTSIKWLQLWVLILLAIRLFLRAEEVCEIKIDQFRSECTILHEEQGRVDQIVLWIKGKTDTEEQCLSLFRDDDNTEFCPVRALLVYIDSAKLEGPYLFPKAELLEDHLSGDNVGDVIWEDFPYSYTDLLNELKEILYAEFSGQPNAFDEMECTIGTHTLRKTGYIFAIFGILYRYESTGRRRTHMAQPLLQLQPLEDDALSKSARHKSLKQAALYYQNCLNKWEDCGFHNSDLWPDYKVSPWMSVYYSTGRKTRRNENPRSRTTKTIIELANWYVTKSLGFSASYTWKEAYHCSLGQVSTNTPSEDLRALFQFLPDDKKCLAESLLSECFRETAKKGPSEIGADATNHVTPDSGSGGGGVGGGSDNGCNGGAGLGRVVGIRRELLQEEDQQARKRQRNMLREERRAGPEDLQLSLKKEREEITKLKGTNLQIYNKIKSVIGQYSDKNSGFVPKDFQWLRRLRTSFAKMRTCVDVCHGGDIGSFVNMQQSLNKVSYKCKCSSMVAGTTPT